MHPTKLIALDVGEKRIGVAVGDMGTRIPIVREAVIVDGHEVAKVCKLVQEENATLVVIGYPRNMSGQTTAQTTVVEAFGKRLEHEGIEVSYQDESLTSVEAEQFLTSSRRDFTKGDIDSHAASIILRDYMESQPQR